MVLSGIGTILSVPLNGFSGTNIIIGIVIGLSATGAHQVYKGFKETKDK